MSDLHKLDEALGGRYRIEREIGKGATGVVYQGWDVTFDRLVAIRVYHRLGEDDRNFQHFLKESKTLAKLQHPNILTIMDCGVVDDFAYHVTKFVDGISL